MASVIAGLKSVDFYRKLKKDLEQELTEASFTSACLSVLAALCMLFLVIAEFSAYMHVTTESTVVLDHGLTGAFEQNEDSLQINFNISFPHLKCEYASVDATNFMGTHDAGLGKRVSKVRLGGSGKSLGRYDDGKIQSNIRSTTLNPQPQTQNPKPEPEHPNSRRILIVHPQLPAEPY